MNKTTRKLMEAVYSGDVGAVEAALRDGASLTEPDESGSPPLIAAALQHGVTGFFSTDAEAMAEWAARPKQHLDVIRLLVERGAPLAARNKNGITALHAAALVCRADVIALLLELGAAVDARQGGGDEDLDGGTPLHSLCTAPLQGQLEEALKALLDAGADPNARTRRGLTPLSLLCRGIISQQAVAGVARLLAAGADPNLRDDRGYTALMTLEDESGNPFGGSRVEEEARKLLLASGATEEGLASLRLIRYADEGDLDAVKAELAAGADPNFVTRRGSLALSAAASGGHSDVVAELLACGADPDGRREGDLPLVAAASDGHLEAVRLLVAAGADVSAGGAWRRPLDVAAAGSPVEAFLEELGAPRTTYATERGCPNLDLTQQVILVHAPAGEVVSGLERCLTAARIERDVLGKRTTIAKASLLVYQLAGHSWSAVQPVSGKPAANRFERALGVALSQHLKTRAVLYDNSDFTATVAWELLDGGETAELLYSGDREVSAHLVPRDHAERTGRPGPQEDEGFEVFFSRAGDSAPEPTGTEEFLDRRARELDLLVPSWSPQDLAGKPGAQKLFFAREKKKTFAAVHYVILES